MNRLSWLACCVTLAGAAAAHADDKRPNILFCFADDWGRYASVYAAGREASPRPTRW